MTSARDMVTPLPGLGSARICQRTSAVSGGAADLPEAITERLPCRVLRGMRALKCLQHL